MKVFFLSLALFAAVTCMQVMRGYAPQRSVHVDSQYSITYVMHDVFFDVADMMEVK